MEELWAKTVKLSKESPYINMSRYYALKGAAEKIAQDLPEEQRKEFLAYAYQHYRWESNYAGD